MILSILLLCLSSTLTDGYGDRARVFLGRGYDVISGNPYVLNPSESDNKFIDEGMKADRVLANKKSEDGFGMGARGALSCGNETNYYHTAEGFQKRVIAEAFLNPNEWRPVLRKYAMTNHPAFPDKSIFLDKYSRCGYDMLYTVGARGMDRVSNDFARAVCKLPKHYNQTDYKHFLIQFGTSVVTGVRVGTLVANRYRKIYPDVTAFAHMFPDVKLSVSETNDKTFIELDAKPDTNRIESEIKADPRGQAHWRMGMVEKPTAITLKLEDIDKYIDIKFWPQCERRRKKCCKKLQSFKKNVQRALDEYPEMLQVKLPQGLDLRVPVVWPGGRYTLVDTGAGCPTSDGHDWQKWTMRHLYDAHVTVPGKNSPSSNFLRSLSKGKVLKWNFCSKTTVTPNEPEWPRGSYCLHLAVQCPKGFDFGWISKSIYKKDDKKGKVAEDETPLIAIEGKSNEEDGKYKQIYYCCRNDAPADSPILLPLNKPFVLLRHGGKCQNVQWMKSTEFSEKISTDQFFHGGKHPDVSYTKPHNIINYCYYEKS